MIAKCAKCDNVFPTDHYGRQSCPRCGAELLLPQPPETTDKEPVGQSPSPASGEPEVPPKPEAPGLIPLPFSAPAPAGSGPDELQDQPTPWEERAKLGLFPAWLATLKSSMLDPVRFFGRMRVDNADGALSYYWINATIGILFSLIWNAALPFRNLGEMSQHPSNAAWLVWIVVAPPIGLYLWAGILHLLALLFKSGDKGFNATLRAVAYSSGGSVLGVVPMCGSLVGGVWVMVLCVIGIWKTQRTSIGIAVTLVVLPLALCCCSVMGLAIAFFSALKGLLH